MAKPLSLLLKLIIFSFFCTSCTDSELSQKSYVIPHTDSSEELSFSAIPEDIQLAAGDTLSVNVWEQNELTKEVTLDSSGNIYFPFIGTLKASGMTIEQLKATITKKLSLYFVAPEVTITPQNLAGQQYYILGEVNDPGRFIIKAQTTVLEAVASAGGPTKNGDESVILLRKNEDKLLIVGIPLSFNHLTENNIPSVTMQVRANDILYLAPSTIANVENFMIRLNNILTPLLSLERGILFWPELIKVIEGASEQEVVLSVQ